MHMAHRTQEELRHELTEAAALVEVGARYTHFKDPIKEYLVVGFVIIEATEEVGVLYEAQYDERITFVRPLQSFIAPVEHEGTTTMRFIKVA